MIVHVECPPNHVRSDRIAESLNSRIEVKQTSCQSSITI